MPFMPGRQGTESSSSGCPRIWPGGGRAGDVSTLSPTDSESIIAILAWSVCNHVWRKKIVTMKEKQMMLVANAKQHAVMRAVQERECRELQDAIGYRKERHKSLGP